LFHTNLMHFSELRGIQNVEESPKTKKSYYLQVPTLQDANLSWKQ
jgi:hypothetical protein